MKKAAALLTQLFFVSFLARAQPKTPAQRIAI